MCPDHSCGSHNYNQRWTCFKCGTRKDAPISYGPNHLPVTKELKSGAILRDIPVESEKYTKTLAEANAHRSLVGTLQRKERQIRQELNSVQKRLEVVEGNVAHAVNHQKSLDAELARLRMPPPPPVPSMVRDLRSHVRNPNDSHPGSRLPSGYGESAGPYIPRDKCISDSPISEVLARSEANSRIKESPKSPPRGLTQEQLDRDLEIYKNTETPAKPRCQKKVSKRQRSPTRSRSRSSYSSESRSRSSVSSSRTRSASSRSRTPPSKKHLDKEASECSPRTLKKAIHMVKYGRYPDSSSSKRVKSTARDDQYPPRRVQRSPRRHK